MSAKIEPEDIELFLRSKIGEIELIILKNIEKRPLEIAKAIVSDLDYFRMPLSLFVTAPKRIRRKK